MVDLHTHSSASDGRLSPCDLVSKAADSGIGTLALTDHDTLDGLADAEKAASESGINFVRGIEFDIEWNMGEFHLLGLGISKEDGAIRELLQSVGKERDERNRRIFEKMRGDGLPVNFDEFAAAAKSASLGRPHIARYLVEKGIASSYDEAFFQYLGAGKKYYVKKTGCDLQAAIDAVERCSGISVLAHPMSLFLSWTGLERLFRRLKSMGASAIEAWHPSAKPSERDRIERLARTAGLAVSAGSDFHSECDTRQRFLGHADAGSEIPDRFWDEEIFPILASKR